MRKALILTMTAALMAVGMTAAHAATSTPESTFGARTLNTVTNTVLAEGESAIVVASVSGDYCMWSGCTPGVASNGDGFPASHNPAMGGVVMGGGQVFVYGLTGQPATALPNLTGVTVAGPGTVSLGINDCAGTCLDDNFGTVTYTVTVVEAPPVLVAKETHGEYVSGAVKAGKKGKELADIAKNVALVGPYPG
jgi:hypothetical protein